MKKQAYMIVAIVMFMTVVGLSSVQAQTSGSTIMQVDIPFAFSIDNRTLPAGEYRVSIVNSASDLKIVQLRNKTGRETVLIRTSSVIGRTLEKATLVFNQYGDRYFFSQAWVAGDNIGLQARKSRIEKVMAGELASVRRAAALVALHPKR